MGYSNQITVDFEGDFLKISNVDGNNPNYERLSAISHIHQNYIDATAINTYSPGHVEFNEFLELHYTVNGKESNDLLGGWDINNVTNQPTWTKDKAGLEKAVSDLLIASGTGGNTYQLPQTDMAAIGATEEIVIPFYTNDPWSIQLNWDTMNALDATIDLLVSSDNVNFQPLDNFVQIACTPTTSSASVEKDDFPYDYLKILITKNAVTSGTIDYFINK